MVGRRLWVLPGRSMSYGVNSRHGCTAAGWGSPSSALRDARDEGAEFGERRGFRPISPECAGPTLARAEGAAGATASGHDQASRPNSYPLQTCGHAGSIALMRTEVLRAKSPESGPSVPPRPEPGRSSVSRSQGRLILDPLARPRRFAAGAGGAPGRRRSRLPVRRLIVTRERQAIGRSPPAGAAEQVQVIRGQLQIPLHCGRMRIGQ